METMVLNWKAFNVDVKAFDAWVKANFPTYQGCATGYELTLGFNEKPSEEVKSAIQAKWDEISSDQHAMAASYVPALVAKAAKASAAVAKLKALGFDDDEIAAMKG